MNRSLLVAITAIILPLSIFAEPSAFGAGDLNNPTPYGLTSSEEILLENKKNLHKVKVKSNNQANEVQSLRERIDGLQSIIESISAASRKNKLGLKDINKKKEEDLKNKEEFDKRFTESTESNTKNIKVNAQELEKINLILVEMSKLVETINTSYVTKEEFNSLVNDVNKFKDLVRKELKSKPSVSGLDSMSNGKVATKAKQYFDKKLYTKSLEYYLHLIKKQYKPAYGHYKVGEIYYNRKSYSDAIAYYKKSAKLYSKASYMHQLMLHTAISMDKTGDKENAKTFYTAVVSKYPSSASAKIAQKKLNQLN